MSRILRSNRLWKTVENRWAPTHPGAALQEPHAATFPAAYEAFSLAFQACSACAGDYEDPDRTAWTTAAEEDEEQLQELVDAAPSEADGDAQVSGDEFPAQEA